MTDQAMRAAPATEAAGEAAMGDWADLLVARARTKVVELTGDGGLLTDRRVVYTTNTVESLNARFRSAVRHRGYFPNEQAAMKVLYLVATTKRKNRQNLGADPVWLTP